MHTAVLANLSAPSISGMPCMRLVPFVEITTPTPAVAIGRAPLHAARQQTLNLRQVQSVAKRIATGLASHTSAATFSRRPSAPVAFTTNDLFFRSHHAS